MMCRAPIFAAPSKKRGSSLSWRLMKRVIEAAVRKSKKLREFGVINHLEIGLKIK